MALMGACGSTDKQTVTETQRPVHFKWLL